LGKEWPTNGILTDCVDCCILAVAQTSDIIYFETLDLPLPELQGLKTLKIAFHNSKTEEVFQRNTLTYFCVKIDALNL
jgi:hypothetical protein